MGFIYIYIHGSSAESLRAPRAHTQARATKDFSFFATKKILKLHPMWILLPTIHGIRYTAESDSLSTNQHMEILESSTQPTAPHDTQLLEAFRSAVKPIFNCGISL